MQNQVVSRGAWLAVPLGWLKAGKKPTRDGKMAALGAADWLCLAAAPTFAIMALLTGVFGGGLPYMVCSAGQEASPLSGMVPMYLLMSAFHAAPWLKLIATRRNGVCRS